MRRFKFPVEILTLQRFKAADGQRAYQFEPFLGDVSEPDLGTHGTTPAVSSTIDPSDIDTIVVPAQEEGFQETVIGENRWHHIRIHASMIPKVRYIAFYRVKPIYAITHYAPVKDIQHWENTSKYVLNFGESPKTIGLIKLVPKGAVKAPSGSPLHVPSKTLEGSESR